MKIIKTIAIILGSILLLLIIIALLTPPIAKNYITKHSKEMIGRQINMEGLYLNIFTGYTRITGFQLLEKNDRDIFVAFDTLSVDMTLYRLLAKEICINHINLINPNVKLLQKGTAFNFDDLLALGQTDSLATTPSSLNQDTVSTAKTANSEMAIALFNINIQGGHIQYKDSLRNSIWQMENFGLQIPGVYFSGQNTKVGIALNFNDGGHLQTAVQYNMEANSYLLDIDLTNFSIAPLRPYLVDFLNIQSINGTLSTHLNIEGNTEHVMDLSIRGNLKLADLTLTDTQSNQVFSTDSIRIDMESINPEKSIFHFNAIAINGIRTSFDLYKEGNNITNLLKPLPEDTAQLNTSTPSSGQPEIAPDLKINNFQINNTFFTFNDHTLHNPFTFTLENINLTANNLTLNQKNKIKINSTLKNGGTITLDYQGKIDDINNTDLSLKIKNLDLKTFTPYSLQYFGYPLKKGILSFSSVNDIRNSILDGRNNLSIAKCEVNNKQKSPKPEYNIPLKTALYLIKDKNDLIKMDLPVQGNIDSPEFSYKKIIFRTLTNLLVKVAVSPINFLANSMGLSPDKLKNIPFEATQNDFTPEQLIRINQLAEIIKAKPEMTLTLEQFVNLEQSKLKLAQFYVQRNYYLQQNLGKTTESLLPIDYSKIAEIDMRDINFLAYVSNQVSEDLKIADIQSQILSLADSGQLTLLTSHLIQKRNTLLSDYLIRQGVAAKCIHITTAPENKLAEYKGKNQFNVDMIFEGDEPDPALVAQEEADN